MTGNLARALAAALPDCTAAEIADVLWLVAAQPGRADDGPAPVPGTQEAAAGDAADPDARPVEKPPGDRRVLVLPYTGDANAGRQTTPARKVGMEVSAAPRQRGSTIRTLGPFARITAPGMPEIDIDATVEATADTDSLVVVTRPAREPCLSLALVTDTSPAMTVFSRQLAELEDWLRRSRTFRSVSRWSLVPGDQMLIRNHSGTAYRPESLASAPGKRVVLMVTDAVSEHWYRSDTWLALQDWARMMPTALIHVLPESYRPRTALGGGQLRMRPRPVVAPNHLATAEMEWWDTGTPGVPVPVLRLDPSSLARWARGVATGTAWLDAVWANPPDRPGPTESNARLTAEDRVRAFEASASDGARALARILATAPSLSWPLISVLQAGVLPLTGPSELAEVIIGGLLEQATDSADNSDGLFRFRSGVAQLLARGRSATQEWDAFKVIAEYLEGHGRTGNAIQALIADPLGTLATDAGPQPFAALGRALAARLGLPLQPSSEDLDESTKDGAVEGDTASARAAAEPAADAGSYMQVLTGWTRSAAALLTVDARDMFWFLCCLEEADRTSNVAETTWPQVRNRLGRQAGPPEVDSLLAVLRRQALITISVVPESTVTRFGIHPAVAAAGRTSAGTAFQAAVDAELGSYWIAANLTAAQTETSQGTGADVVAAGLHAAPYLLRTGRWDDSVALLEDSLARDHSRTTIAAVIPLLRELATALRGQPNEYAAVGTLARALRMIDPAAAERELASVLDAAVARGDYVMGFIASDDLCWLMRESGRLGTALSYAEQSRDFAIRAGLGPWTLLAAERSRLLILLDQGHAEQVLTEVRDLAAQAASLPPEPGDNEIAKSWMTEESLLDTGRAAALRLEHWDSALTYNSAAMKSMRRRGASAADLARARFGDYGPLLGLGRNDEALAVVQECKAAAEQDRDIEMLGVVFGALAEVEDARGHQKVAADRCKDSLRYLYRVGNPTDVAGGHSRLGNYTGRGGVSHRSAVTQFLAAALLHELSGTGQASNPVNAAAAHLRAGQDEAMLPANAAELCARVRAVPGCDLAGLLGRIWPDNAVVERTYQGIVHRVRTAATQPGATVIAVAQWDPVIAALQEAADGSTEAAEAAEKFLSALESQPGRAPLAGALRRITNGELDAASLAANLNESDAAIVERALDAIAGRIEVRRALWAAAPIAGFLLDLVMACRGAPKAPARARQALGFLSSLQEWSGLVPVLERILAGERDAALLDGLTNPMHTAVVELVLTEIARTNPIDRH